MIDQLTIGEKSSFDDFGASLAKRTIGAPKKKTIKETLPYSNNTYDFSAINGEVYWEERELEYIFEMTASTPEDLEDMKTAFANWVMNVMNEDIFDPFIFGYHFVGTFSEMDFEDDEGLDKTTATVKFTAYPYKLANNVKKYTYTVAAGATIDVAIINDSAHRVTPMFKASGEILIKRETETALESWGFGAGEGILASGGKIFMLEKGVTTLSLNNTKSTACTLEIWFNEEVL